MHDTTRKGSHEAECLRLPGVTCDGNVLRPERCVLLQEAQNKLKAACSEPSNSPKGLQLLLPPKADPEPAESQPSPEADTPEAAAAGIAGQALSADGQKVEDEEEAESQVTQPVEVTDLGSEALLAVAEPSSNEIAATAFEAVEAELFQQQPTSDEAAIAGHNDAASGSGSSEQQGAVAASPGGSGCDRASDTAAVQSPKRRSAALSSTDSPAAETSASRGPEGPAISESTAMDKPLLTATPSPSAMAAAGLSSAVLSESPTQTVALEHSAGSTPQPGDEAAAKERRLAAAEEPGFARPTLSSMLRQRPAAGPAKSRLSTDLGSVSTLAGCQFEAGYLLWLAAFLHNIQSCSVALWLWTEFSCVAHT